MILLSNDGGTGWQCPQCKETNVHDHDCCVFCGAKVDVPSAKKHSQKQTMVDEMMEAALRDKFAIVALEKLIEADSYYTTTESTDENWEPWLAKKAYTIADEMLKARKGESKS